MSAERLDSKENLKQKLEGALLHNEKIVEDAIVGQVKNGLKSLKTGPQVQSDARRWIIAKRSLGLGVFLSLTYHIGSTKLFDPIFRNVEMFGTFGSILFSIVLFTILGLFLITQFDKELG